MRMKFAAIAVTFGLMLTSGAPVEAAGAGSHALVPLAGTGSTTMAEAVHSRRYRHYKKRRHQRRHWRYYPRVYGYTYYRPYYYKPHRRHYRPHRRYHYRRW